MTLFLWAISTSHRPPGAGHRQNDLFHAPADGARWPTSALDRGRFDYHPATGMIRGVPSEWAPSVFWVAPMTNSENGKASKRQNKTENRRGAFLF